MISDLWNCQMQIECSLNWFRFGKLNRTVPKEGHGMGTRHQATGTHKSHRMFISILSCADGRRLHRNAFAIISQQSVDTNFATAVADAAAQLTKWDYFARLCYICGSNCTMWILLVHCRRCTVHVECGMWSRYPAANRVGVGCTDTCSKCTMPSFVIW